MDLVKIVTNKYFIEAVIFAVVLIAYFIIRRNKKKNLKIITAICVLFCGLVVVEVFTQNPEFDTAECSVQVEVSSKGQKMNMPKVKYFFSDVTDKVEIVGDIDYSKVGDYDVVYKVPTLHGDYEYKYNIHLVDTTAPEITLDGGDSIECSYAKEYKEIGFKAIDDYEGDLTQKVITTKEEISKDEYNIKYEVEDSAGNKAVKYRNIKLVDDVPPKITLNGSDSMTIYLNNKYTEKGATAKDEKDGDLTKKIKIEGSVDTSKVGTYKITYKVTDSQGNEAKKVRTIKVKVFQTATTGGDAGQAGVIYLTFDDGPSSSITPKILDILKAKNVKATFFVLNYNSTGEQLIKREHAEGHTVAIHGYSHDYGKVYKSDEACMQNITKLQAKINKSIGISPTIIRFPGGSSNTVSCNYSKGIMTRMTQKVLDNGFRYFDWNVSSGDAGGAQNSQAVYKNVTKALKKSRANIVLMHDFSGNTKTLNALEDIIDYGIENGYTFSRITENTPMVTHGVNN